ncbi:MAG TPA: cytochrome c [Campylobacterales bacterium]|nr:cytochrome c [Campylobacterales bacterium]
MRIGLFILLLLVNSINADESFISNDEYAKMLYKNPRGIGCDKCHGEYGEGKEISSYISGKNKISLIGPRINNLSMRQFKKALKKGKRLMPEYFLTDEEKAFLYYYLITQNKKGLKFANSDKQ